MGLVTNILDTRDLAPFHHHRKFYWTCWLVDVIKTWEAVKGDGKGTNLNTEIIYMNRLMAFKTD